MSPRSKPSVGTQVGMCRGPRGTGKMLFSWWSADPGFSVLERQQARWPFDLTAPEISTSRPCLQRGWLTAGLHGPGGQGGPQIYAEIHLIFRFS